MLRGLCQSTSRVCAGSVLSRPELEHSFAIEHSVFESRASRHRGLCFRDLINFVSRHCASRSLPEHHITIRAIVLRKHRDVECLYRGCSFGVHRDCRDRRASVFIEGFSFASIEIECIELLVIQHRDRVFTFSICIAERV